MKINNTRSYFLLFILPLIVMTKANATLIDTTPSWNGSSGTCCFGEGSTDTYGQTFSVGGQDTVLNSFSFWIDDRTDVNRPIDFAAYVMEWHDATGIADYSHVVGSVLYSSFQKVTTNNGENGGMELFTFNTGGLQTQSGKKYVAFISSSLFWDGVNSSGYVGSIGNCCDGTGNVYGSGDFVLISNGNNFMPYISEAGWNRYSQDLAFVANFSSPVPLPAAFWLFGSGVIGLFGFMRRR